MLGEMDGFNYHWLLNGTLIGHSISLYKVARLPENKKESLPNGEL